MEAFERRSATPPAGPATPYAELDELQTLRIQLELALDAANIGTFDWDLGTGGLRWDVRLKRLMRQEGDAQPTVAEFVRRILPADRPAMQAATEQAIRTCQDLRVDFRVTDEAGATRWLTTRGRVLCDADGVASHMMGAVYDSSGIHTDRELVAQALDTMATAYATVDTDWNVTYANQAARAVLSTGGGQPIEPVGRAVWNLVPGLSEPVVVDLLRGVMSGREAQTVELHAERNDRWLELSAQPVANGIAVLVSDVTDRRKAQIEAEREARRVTMLAQAGTALVQRRPVTETVAVGLGILVPELARFAVIYLREAPGLPYGFVGLRSEDPAAEAGLHSLFEALPLGNDPATSAGQAVLTGRTQIVGDLDEAAVARTTDDPQLRERLLALGGTGVLVVPLVSRGESIGLLGLFGAGGQTPLGPDLVLIEDVASRIATALDNAQIFRQVQLARRTAESVTARLAFLASVADALGSTLDAERASRRLARMLTPTLADWCLVTLVDDEGRVEHIAGSASDPEQQDLLDRYAKGRRQSLERDAGIIAEVVNAGQPLFRADGAAYRERLSGDPAAEALQELDPGALTALPILARDRTLGVISLYTSRTRGPLDDEDLATAREVARRAGLVFDNARLYARSRGMAETLQRSLLTEPAEPPALQVATRYVPAVADSQVGGDWYDAFQTAAGTTTLVIGDVMGHDTEAAANMGQLRTLVRAIAVDRQGSPSSVLERVDAAAAALGVDTTATAVLAQVTDGAADPAAPRLLRWSNAGHPPPVLVHPDGRVHILDSPADLLIGLGSGFRRADHEATLPVGATVLMFTDGLVEGRAQPLDIGMRRLALTVGPLSSLPLQELCDQLLEALLPEPGAEDDVALVAVRVAQPARPAPATATSRLTLRT